MTTLPVTVPVTCHPSAVTAPIGLLGGTFDPIHLGHLRLAEEMAEVLGLAEVRFLPGGMPPHRPAPVAPAVARRDMVGLAIAGNPRFVLDEHEVFQTTPGYMVDTLAALRAELGTDTPLVLILGADAFAGLEGWSRWRRLFDLAHLAVAHRPGIAVDALENALPAELRAEFDLRRAREPGELSRLAAGRIWPYPMTALDISASRLRERMAHGQSLRYLMPDAVIDYIHRHALYR